MSYYSFPGINRPPKQNLLKWRKDEQFAVVDTFHQRILYYVSLRLLPRQQFKNPYLQISQNPNYAPNSHHRKSTGVIA
jgi:hypothetical protein